MSGDAVLISPTHIALLILVSLNPISLSSSLTRSSNLRNVLITIHDLDVHPKIPQNCPTLLHHHLKLLLTLLLLPRLLLLVSVDLLVPFYLLLRCLGIPQALATLEERGGFGPELGEEGGPRRGGVEPGRTSSSEGGSAW
jgi:hypothetical protein